MPNWCRNNVVITGSKDSIDEPQQCELLLPR